MDRDWFFRTDEYICDLRTVGVLIRNGKLLVQRDRDGSEYALPGGHVKIGETTADGLVREYREETGAEIKVGKLLWTEECFWKWNGTQAHNIAFYYLIELTGGCDIPDDGEIRGNYCQIALLSAADKPYCIAAWGKNRFDLGDRVGELICIHSLQDGWGKGYGSAMMQYVLAELKQAHYESVILWVFEANTRARRFYEKHGFVPTEQKKLTNGIVELMYRKDI